MITTAAFNWSRVDMEKLREWWLDSTKKPDDFFHEFGVTFDRIKARAREERWPWREPNYQKKVADPTPEEIAERAAEVRAIALQRLLDEDERATQKRVSANNCERVTIRAFTYAGECYRSASAFA